MSPIWLNENGICLDNIQQGKSTLPQAGRGAFARRRLKEGSIVSPSPVIPVHDLSWKSLKMTNTNCCVTIAMGTVLRPFCFARTGPLHLTSTTQMIVEPMLN